MFRATSAHLQEVPVINYTIMQPLVFLFSAGSRLVHLLKFRATSAHLQEVPVINYTIMQLLVFLFSAGSRLVHLLKEDSLPSTSAQDGYLQRMRTPEAT
jgi:cytochrome c oxidase subunit IV